MGLRRTLKETRRCEIAVAMSPVRASTKPSSVCTGSRRSIILRAASMRALERASMRAIETRQSWPDAMLGPLGRKRLQDTLPRLCARAARRLPHAVPSVSTHTSAGTIAAHLEAWTRRRWSLQPPPGTCPPGLPVSPRSYEMSSAAAWIPFAMDTASGDLPSRHPPTAVSRVARPGVPSCHASGLSTGSHSPDTPTMWMVVLRGRGGRAGVAAVRTGRRGRARG